jgi:hypothetical protein
MLELHVRVPEECRHCNEEFPKFSIIAQHPNEKWMRGCPRCGKATRCEPITPTPSAPKPLESFEGLEGRTVRHSNGQTFVVVGKRSRGGWWLESESDHAHWIREGVFNYTLVEEDDDA